MLHSAIRRRDLGLCKKLIGESESSYKQASLGALSSSAGATSFHGKRFERTVDVNERDLDGCTPLLKAVSMGHREIVQALLICRKVDVNAVDWESGYTALHKALYNGDLDMALSIIKVRPDCDFTVRDKEGLTCLDLLNYTKSDNSATAQTFSHSLSDADDSDDDSDSIALQQSSIDYSTSIWTWGANSNYVGPYDTLWSVKTFSEF
jgi:hypothetical protein